jgi:CRP/FNR family cyclic AMP-dependent transcriptional regulator
MNLRNNEFVAKLIASSERKGYLSRAVLIAQGETSRDLYFLLKGVVTLRLRTPSGHDLVLDVTHAGQFFGEAGLFETGAVNTSGVRAKTICEIARISHAHLRSHPELLAGLLPLLAPQLALRLDGLYRKSAEMAFYDTHRRVTSALRELARAPDAHPHADGSAISVTRTELGSMTGASREAVGRVLVRLQQQGVVRAKGRAMIVLHPTAGAARDLPSRGVTAAAGAAPPA